MSELVICNERVVPEIKCRSCRHCNWNMNKCHLLQSRIADTVQNDDCKLVIISGSFHTIDDDYQVPRDSQLSAADVKSIHIIIGAMVLIVFLTRSH